MGGNSPGTLRTPVAAPAAARARATAWLDTARVCAMLAVIVVHAVSPAVTTVDTDLGTRTWWVANAVDASVRWCVPVFVMISGALLLAPREEGLRRFYAKRFSRIGVPLVVWTAIYLYWEMWRTGISASDGLEDILSGNPATHLYFLFVLSGLYVLTPFLRVIVEHSMTSTLWCFAALLSVLGMADQAISALDGTGEPNAATRFLPFLGYYVIGYLLRDVDLGRGGRWAAGFAFLAGGVTTAAGAALLARVEGGWGDMAGYVYDYLSPTVLVLSVAAYLLFRAAGTRLAARSERRRGTAVPRFLRVLAELSFGVFLVHVMVLYTLRDILGMPEGPVPMLAMSAAMIVATLAVSLTVTAVLRRVPWLRAIV